MGKAALIMFMLSIACSAFAANPVAKGLAEALVQGGKFESRRLAKEGAEALAEKEAAKVCSKECLRLCEKYPAARALIMKNGDEFVLLSKRFGDDAVKHEIANPGILKFGEDVFGADGVGLLAKESPETFFNLTKYFKRKPELAGAYLGAYKIADKLATPKNIVATGFGFGLFKICCDGGASVRELASGISDTVGKIAEKNPIAALFAIFSAILLFASALFGTLKRLFAKLFSPLLCAAKKFGAALPGRAGWGKSASPAEGEGKK